MLRTLIYVHDPMCSWCWAFRPTLGVLLNTLPDSLHVKRLLGGLAPDSDAPMSEEMRRYLSQTWKRIQQQVPGTEFNFDYWERCRPRRSTYPACRAVIAARQQDPSSEDRMVLKIQRAYYTEARNPSDIAVLVELSEETGLDTNRFLRDLRSAETDQRLKDEITYARKLGSDSFPSLILELGNSRWPISVNYRDAHVMQELIMDLVDT